jgi:hypothetical protein
LASSSDDPSNIQRLCVSSVKTAGQLDSETIRACQYIVTDFSRLCVSDLFSEKQLSAAKITACGVIANDDARLCVSDLGDQLSVENILSCGLIGSAPDVLQSIESALAKLKGEREQNPKQETERNYKSLLEGIDSSSPGRQESAVSRSAD